MERKWHLELNEARESDIPHRLEPVGFARGITAEKVRLARSTAVIQAGVSNRGVVVVQENSNSAVAKAGENNTRDLKQKVRTSYD